MQPEAVTELYRRTVAQGEKMSVGSARGGEGIVDASPPPQNEEVIILLKGCWRFHFRYR